MQSCSSGFWRVHSKALPVSAMLMTVVVFLTLGASSLWAQLGAGTPLPADYKLDWKKGDTTITSFELNPPIQGSTDDLIGFLGFNTDEKRVWLWTVFRDLSTTTNKGDKSRWYSTSFAPTAVEKRAGIARSFFVAGYEQRTGAVVVELWSYKNVTAAKFLPAGAPSHKTQLTLDYSIERELVYRTSDHNPIIGMASVPFSGDLLLLTGGASKQLLRLNIDTGEAEIASEASSVADLNQYHSLFYRVANTQHPDGPHAIAYLRPLHVRNYALEPHPAPNAGMETIHLMTDGDLDGAFETHSLTTYGALMQDGTLASHLTSAFNETGQVLE